MREVVIDTETTGLNTSEDRIFEIACIEMIDYEITGNEFHYYVNPCKRLSNESIEISGVQDNFLLDKPLFSSIVNEFLDFIGNDTIVAHNANFDVSMINSELTRLGRKTLTNPVIDTLQIAREVYPRGNNTLDNLCKKLRVNTSRGHHDALGDARDLSMVYYYLSINKGSSMSIDQLKTQNLQEEEYFQIRYRINPDAVSENEIEIHQDFCKKRNIKL